MEAACSDTSSTSARLVYPMLNGVANKHGAVPSDALAHRCTVAPFHVDDDDVPICAPKPSGSDRARAFLKSSVVPELSDLTTTRISDEGSLPDAVRLGLSPPMRGSSHMVMFPRKISPSTCFVSTSAGSAALTLGRW
eukprot:scaffold22738_cov31-Tisochrysis_lutea.AAC.11